MKTVSTFEAKNRLSELISAAEKGRPQIITRNGKEAAVIISYAEFRTMSAKRGTLVDLFLNSPLRGSEINLTRSKAVAGRETISFDEES